MPAHHLFSANFSEFQGIISMVERGDGYPFQCRDNGDKFLN